MESKKNVSNTYSLDFKLKVLSDMCENGLSTFGVAKKIWYKNPYDGTLLASTICFNGKIIIFVAGNNAKGNGYAQET